MLNSAGYANTLLEVPQVIDTKLVIKLKEIYKDAFDESCSYNDAKEVAGAFKSKLKEMYVDVSKLLLQKKQYHFLDSLTAFGEKLAKLSDKEYLYYLNHIEDFEDELLDFKEELLDPTKRFMNSDQVAIYDAIKAMLEGDTSNLSYIEGNEVQVLKELMNHPKPYLGDTMKEAKASKDRLTVKVLAKQEEEKEISKQAIEKAIADIKGKEEFSKLNGTQREQIIAPFETELYRLASQRYIALIRDIRSKVKESIFTQQLNEMMVMVAPKPYKEIDTTIQSEDVFNPPAPLVHYINKNNIKTQFPKTELRSDKDVDDYVEAYRKALKEQIKNNRRIQL